MKLLKIIIVFFLIYFIRRFIQMYKVVKRLHDTQVNPGPQAAPPNQEAKKNVVEADFKVVD